MGLTSREMLTVVAELTRRHFYKSMTTYADHSIWQDVYYSPPPVDRDAYQDHDARHGAGDRV
jgi:motility quorum-sensing regulator/GCU-specific mRNA interferase toxin